jgi:PKD repeat protein
MALRSLPLALALLILALAPAASANAAGSDFTITPNDPPNQGQQATFTFVPGPGVVDPTSVEWDITHTGADPTDFEATGNVATHTYDSAGSATVRMRVTKDDKSEIVTKTFTVNGWPVVDFDFEPTSPFPDQQVLFSPFYLDPEGDAVTLAWNFGTGAIPVGANRATYTSPGTRTVTLTATDARGAVGVQTRDLTVQDPAGPSPDFTFFPAVPLVGEAVTFTDTSTPSSGFITAWEWDLDNDGEFDDGKGASVSWAFGAGNHQVSMRITQSNGNRAVREKHIRVNAPPTAAFVWSPGNPVAGQPADLISLSGDVEGALAVQAWDLDGDAQFDDGNGPTVRHAFPRAGTYDVGIQVTDSDGVVRRVRQAITVARPGFITPFPVVRLSGRVLPHGARVRLLAVRAPRGTRVRVRCGGKGCPVRAARATSAGATLRFRRFERRLPAGVRLEIFVRRPQVIGKYTRFLIRAGAPPRRTDRCLFPGIERPRACP